jgi:hypothetical protein
MFSPGDRRMEDAMKPIARLATMVTGLALLLNITPSWGQAVCVAPGCNATVSGISGNTAAGTNALKSDGGSDNTAVGIQALYSSTTGPDNTASGAYALNLNTVGSSNTAAGVAALEQNISGNNNTAMGVDAQVFNETGSGNTAMGMNALSNNSAGNDNTALGFKALKKSLGTKNIGIGYQAGVSLTNGNNNIYIGNQGAGDESQTIRIGTAQTTTFLAGINTAGVTGTAVVVDANGQLAQTSARHILLQRRHSGGSALWLDR